MMRKETVMNLEDLKPGDTACMLPARSEPEIVTVERVTKTQVIAEGRRFNKRTGRMVGAEWGPSLYPATPDLVRRAEIEAARNRVRSALYEADVEMRSRQQRPGVVLGWAQVAAKAAEDWAALAAATENVGYAGAEVYDREDDQP